MSRAVCVRCGKERMDFRQICPACGHRPEGEGLLVAWLLSDHNLDAEQLDAVAERVRAGEAIRPSDRMLDTARRALGTHLASDPGLTGTQKLGLLLTSILLTPLVGWTVWFWWRRERPRAALQALSLSLPWTVVFTVGVLWAALNA